MRQHIGPEGPLSTEIVLQVMASSPGVFGSTEYLPGPIECREHIQIDTFRDPVPKSLCESLATVLEQLPMDVFRGAARAPRCLFFEADARQKTAEGLGRVENKRQALG